MISNKSTTVVGYVERKIKQRMEKLAKMDRHLSISRMIDEALREYVPKKEKEMLGDKPVEDERRYQHQAQLPMVHAMSM